MGNSYVFTGDGGTNNQDDFEWTNAYNWALDGTPGISVPGAGDVAMVDGGFNPIDAEGATVAQTEFQSSTASQTIYNTLTGTLTTTDDFSVLGSGEFGSYLTLDAKGRLNASSPSAGSAAIQVDNNAVLDDYGVISETLGGVNVGFGEDGTLIIAKGGSATFENNTFAALTLGDDNAAIGTLTVTGTGSTLTVERNAASFGGGANIGYNGTGALDVDDGGLATFSSGLFLASNAKSQGTINVGDATANNAATLNVTDAFTVGYGGNGYLNIYANAEVDDTSSVGVDLASLASSNAVVDDFGTFAIDDAGLTVGDGGLADMYVNGGSVSAETLVVANLNTSGDTATPKPSLLALTDDASLTLTGAATVGDDGYGWLTVDSGANASMLSLTVASAPSSGSLGDDAPSYVEVSGPNPAGTGVSAMYVTNDIVVGLSGYGHLAVTNGGYASGSTLDVAVNASSDESWVLVEGVVPIYRNLAAALRPPGGLASQAQTNPAPNSLAQSTLSISGAATVGDDATGYAQILTGGYMAADSLTIAVTVNSGQTTGAGSPSYVLVSGSGSATVNNALQTLPSELNVTNKIVVGEAGYGALQVENGAEAFGGSLVIADQSTSGLIGASHTADSEDSGLLSFAQVDGAGSSLSISGALTSGNAGYGGLLITNGGAATVGSADIAAKSSSGSTAVYDRSYVDADGKGSSFTDNGAAIVGDAGYGALTDFNGATTTIHGSLTIAAQASSGSAAGAAPSFVDVSGAGATITLDNPTATVIVGDLGDGQLSVGHGGAFDASGLQTEIAAGSGSTGEVDVDDGTLNIDAVAVGGTASAAGGAGSLNVTNGGTVTVHNQVGTDVNVLWGGTIAVDSKSLLAIGSSTPGATTGLDIENFYSLSGYGTIAAATLNQGTITAQAGKLTLNGALTGGGGVTINSGATFALPVSVASSQTLTFANNKATTGTLDFSGEGKITETAAIDGFTGSAANSDVIEVAGSGVAGDKVIWSPGTLEVETSDGTVLDTLALSGTYVQSQFVVTENGGVDQITYDAPCYARGTRILTARGEVAVESLRVGDLAITASGARRPVVWLGHRALALARRRDATAVLPIRIAAHAFGENLPRRDLWVSPGHNIASEGALIPASALVNGISVRQMRVAAVEYWHVELDAHDILLAEGLPAESYLDCGNRAAFANGGAFIEAHPDFEPKHWAETCLPLVKHGPQVERAKAALIARLRERGYDIDSEADAHIVVDGRRIAPIRLGDARLGFALPEGGREIALASRTFVPAQTVAASADPRRLGLCVGRLQIDGDAVPLDEAAGFGGGWHEAEDRDGRLSHRWTDGAARLPAGARIVVVDLAGEGLYWRASGEAMAMAG